ncbi:hypothetical protein [Sphingobacterium cellulitidis]|uniref:hypothetical protein n=1 Tax=Sphingobacterium cellulitidis TaxID=1768011 RepID=UPI00146F82F3
MKTPSFISQFSSHSTAILCAAFSEFTPTKSGNPFGLMFFKRIRQIPTIAFPSNNFGLKGFDNIKVICR